MARVEATVQKIFGGVIMAGADELQPAENQQEDLLSLEDLIEASDTNDANITLDDIQIEENTNQDVVKGMAKSGAIPTTSNQVVTIEDFIEKTRDFRRATEFRAVLEYIKSTAILEIQNSNSDDKNLLTKTLEGFKLYNLCNKLMNINKLYRKNLESAETEEKTAIINKRDELVFITVAPFFGLIDFVKNRV